MKSERQIENSFIEKLKELKYVYRDDIKDKATLEEKLKIETFYVFILIIISLKMIKRFQK